MSHPHLNLQTTLSSLPPAYSTSHLLRQETRSALKTTPNIPLLVILDDDPTGTQTCHDINVLTTWTTEVLTHELISTPAGSGFFILTNSRALHPAAARALVTEICQNLRAAALAADMEFEVVLRSDSTLRGHFPLEAQVVEEVLGTADVWILAPFFLQGGRYTIGNVHYVAEGEVLVPAGETPFARDASFGYRSSDLRDWVVEKCAGSGKVVSRDDVVGLELERIRKEGPEYVTSVLMEVEKGSGSGVVVVVNAGEEADMDVVVLGVLRANEKGVKALFRTGAAFVSARLGIDPIPPISAKDLGFTPGTGGLILAGSYVPKTTAQLDTLVHKSGTKLSTIVLDVERLIAGEQELTEIIDAAEKDLSNGQDVLVMTSRKLITGGNERESLDIGAVVAKALVEFLQRLGVRPRYIIAKGGITSSDAASKALGFRRARVVGQAAPGVPLWRCDEETCKWPGLPYVVFPGNVGGTDTLFEVVDAWRKDL